MCQAKFFFEVGVEILGSRLRLRLRLGLGSRCSSVFLLFRLAGWVEWLEKSDIKLTSAKVEIKVEAELSKNSVMQDINLDIKQFYKMFI